MFDNLKDKKISESGRQNITEGNNSAVPSQETNTSVPPTQARTVIPNSVSTAGNKLEDIFSDTETEQKPAVFQPKENVVSPKPGADFNDIKKPKALINKLFAVSNSDCILIFFNSIFLILISLI